MDLSSATLAESLHGLKVLVVDDDRDSRIIYREWLRFTGCRALEAHDGTECVQVAREMAPDLIVLDLVLPRTDGWSAARQLRGDAETARIPILGVSGWVYPGDEAAALAAGCDTFLRKPLRSASFLAGVAALRAKHTANGRRELGSG